MINNTYISTSQKVIVTIFVVIMGENCVKKIKVTINIYYTNIVVSYIIFLKIYMVI